jgi:hypothetical protein
MTALIVLLSGGNLHDGVSSLADIFDSGAGENYYSGSDNWLDGPFIKRRTKK